MLVRHVLVDKFSFVDTSSQVRSRLLTRPQRNVLVPWPSLLVECPCSAEGERGYGSTGIWPKQTTPEEPRVASPGTSPGTSPGQLFWGLLQGKLLMEASGGLAALFPMSLVMYRIGHLARVVIRQELGVWNQNGLNL